MLQNKNRAIELYEKNNDTRTITKIYGNIELQETIIIHEDSRNIWRHRIARNEYIDIVVHEDMERR